LESTPALDSIALIASKKYINGLVIISIYCERCFYFIVQSGEGDQALLDVRFPDVSKHGQGLHVSNLIVKIIKVNIYHFF